MCDAKHHQKSRYLWPPEPKKTHTHTQDFFCQKLTIKIKTLYSIMFLFSNVSLLWQNFRENPIFWKVMNNLRPFWISERKNQPKKWKSAVVFLGNQNSAQACGFSVAPCRFLCYILKYYIVTITNPKTLKNCNSSSR